MIKPLPPLEVLNELLACDADNGMLFWKERGSHHFSTGRSHNCWNARYAGKQALTGGCLGYTAGHILSQRFYAHRVIYFMHYRVEPIQVDHIDGNRSNNRISNLRDVNQSVNMKNLGLRSNAAYSSFGISEGPNGTSWTASITHKNEKIHLGTFNSVDEAVACRLGAETVLGFHVGHGRRAATSRIAMNQTQHGTL